MNDLMNCAHILKDGDVVFVRSLGSTPEAREKTAAALRDLHAETGKQFVVVEAPGGFVVGNMHAQADVLQHAASRQLIDLVCMEIGYCKDLKEAADLLTRVVRDWRHAQDLVHKVEADHAKALCDKAETEKHLTETEQRARAAEQLAVEAKEHGAETWVNLIQAETQKMQLAQDLAVLRLHHKNLQADYDLVVKRQALVPPNPFDHVIGQLFCEHGDVDVLAEAHVGDEVLKGCMRFLKGTGDRLNFRFEVEPTEADRACAAAEGVPVQVAIARRRAHALQRRQHRIKDFVFVMGQAQKEALPRQAAGHEARGIGPDLPGMPDRMNDLDFLEDA